MARIAGVDVPDNKRGEIGLTYIFGIGKRSAQKILTEAGVDWNKKVSEWSEDEAGKIRTIIGEQYKVEGLLKSEVQLSINWHRNQQENMHFLHHYNQIPIFFYY